MFEVHKEMRHGSTRTGSNTQCQFLMGYLASEKLSQKL